jgi:hypothetical protein
VNVQLFDVPGADYDPAWAKEDRPSDEDSDDVDGTVPCFSRVYCCCSVAHIADADVCDRVTPSPACPLLQPHTCCWGTTVARRYLTTASSTNVSCTPLFAYDPGIIHAKQNLHFLTIVRLYFSMLTPSCPCMLSRICSLSAMQCPHSLDQSVIVYSRSHSIGF